VSLLALVTNDFEPGPYARPGGAFTVDVGNPALSGGGVEFPYSSGGNVRHISLMDPAKPVVRMQLPGPKRDGPAVAVGPDLLGQWVKNTYDDGISLDTFVDWLNDSGYRIGRIDNYREWLSRFETALRSLSEEQRQSSALSVLGPYSLPQAPMAKSRFPAQRFCGALQAIGFDLPHLSAELINKYVADLRHLRLI